MYSITRKSKKHSRCEVEEVVFECKYLNQLWHEIIDYMQLFKHSNKPDPNNTNELIYQRLNIWGQNPTRPADIIIESQFNGSTYTVKKDSDYQMEFLLNRNR